MRRTRRVYKKVVAKPKWSCNVSTGNILFNGPTTDNSTVNSGLITQNSTRDNNSTGAAIASSSSIVTVGRFEVKCAFGNYFANFTNVEVYICYVPEVALSRMNAQTISNSSLFDATTGFLPYVHPEWILSWKKLTWNTNTSENSTFTLYSAKKRKLQPGDAIVITAIMRAATTIQTSTGPTISFTARYWAKNN